jgi:hypothetical protein
MAFVVQSVGASSNQVGDTSNVAKPSGLAVGDIMVAHVVFYADGAAGGSDSVTPPSGWAEIDLTLIDGGMMYSAWKIADSSDVAASTFDFTSSGTAGNRATMGRIMRITGGRESNVAYVSEEGGGTGTTITVGTITPSVANSLIVFLVGAGHSANPQSASAYAMATSNPSWTEQYNAQYDTGAQTASIAAATAVRPETTATGNNTATLSASHAWAGHVFAIEPALSVSSSDSVTLTESAKMGLSTVKTETVIVTDDMETEDVLPWTNPDKSSTSWANPDKS